MCSPGQEQIALPDSIRTGTTVSNWHMSCIGAIHTHQGGSGRQSILRGQYERSEGRCKAGGNVEEHCLCPICLACEAPLRLQTTFTFITAPPKSCSALVPAARRRLAEEQGQGLGAGRRARRWRSAWWTPCRRGAGSWRLPPSARSWMRHAGAGALLTFSNDLQLDCACARINK